MEDDENENEVEGDDDESLFNTSNAALPNAQTKSSAKEKTGQRENDPKSSTECPAPQQPDTVSSAATNDKNSNAGTKTPPIPAARKSNDANNNNHNNNRPSSVGNGNEQQVQQHGPTSAITTKPSNSNIGKRTKRNKQRAKRVIQPITRIQYESSSDDERENVNQNQIRPNRKRPAECMDETNDDNQPSPAKSRLLDNTIRPGSSNVHVNRQHDTSNQVQNQIRHQSCKKSKVDDDSTSSSSIEPLVFSQ